MSRILIIEDEENLSNFVSLELQHEGYETKICENGREGLDTALNEDATRIKWFGSMSPRTPIKEYPDYYDDCP